MAGISKSSGLPERIPIRLVVIKILLGIFRPHFSDISGLLDPAGKPASPQGRQAAAGHITATHVDDFRGGSPGPSAFSGDLL